MRKPKKIRRDSEIVHVGTMMSNVMFNLGQRGDGVSNIHLSANEYAPFKELQKQWDDALRKYRKSFKRKVGE